MFNFKNSNSGKIRVKLLATLLVLTLTFANFALVGSYIGEAIAAEIDLLNQNKETQSANVEFDVYLDKEEDTVVREKVVGISQETTLYVVVNVKNAGRLENATIELANTNFKFKNIPEATSVKLADSIQAGNETSPIEIPIVVKDEESFDLSLLNMQSQIKLKGQYVNGSGNSTEIDATKAVKIEWTANEITEEDIDLTQEIITNKIYNIDGENKRIVQLMVKTKLKDNKAPVKSSVLEILNPEIESNPIDVKVASIGTEATNEKTLWSSTEENGKTTISVLNNAEESIVSWKKNAQDIFIITYVYDGNVEIPTFVSNVKNTVELYGRTPTEEDTTSALERTDDLELETEQELDEIENIGNIVTVQNSVTENIFKGKMYLGQDTNYQTTSNIYVSYSNIIDELLFTEQTEEIVEGISTYFKTTKINKADAISVLGAEGIITIFNAEDMTTPIETIDLATKEIEGDYYTVSYTDDISQIDIVMSNAQQTEENMNLESEGLIEIINEKTIKVTNTEVVADLTQLKSNASIQVLDRRNNNGTVTSEQLEIVTNASVANLVEPKTTFDISFDKTSLSTQTENSLIVSAELITKDESNKLFKGTAQNPIIINIELPEEIINAEIVENGIASAFYNTGLSLVSAQIETSESGNKVLVIKVVGEQNEYSANSSIITVELKIKANAFIADKSVVINATCINDGEIVQSTENISLLSKIGLITKNKLTIAEESIEEINKNNISADITENTNANISTAILNNFGESVSNIAIVGNLPEEVTLTSAILSNTQGVEIYYSEEQNAVVNSNSWTNQVTDYSKMKSFKVSLKEFTKGTLIDLNYNINANIENVENNTSLTNMLNVNYEIVEQPKEEQITITFNVIKDKIELLEVGEQDGKAKITMIQKTTTNQLHENQILTYQIKVQNISAEELRNVTLDYAIPEGTVATTLTYAQGAEITFTDDEESINKTWKIEGIAPNETITKEITLKIKNGTSQIVNNVNLKNSENNIIAQFESEPVEVRKGDLTVRISRRANMEIDLTTGNEIIYAILVTNNTDSVMNNLNITSKVPEFTSWVENAEQNTNWEYNETTKAVSYNISTLNPGETKDIRFVVEVGKIDNNYSKISIENTAAVTTSSGEIYETNIYTSNVLVPKFDIHMTAEHNERLNEGDTVKYIITVTNTGTRSSSVYVKDVLPEEIQFRRLTYYINETKIFEDTSIKSELVVSYSVEVGETLTIIIEGVTYDLEEAVSSKEISNVAKLHLGNEEYLESETIVNTIVNDLPENSGEPSNPENPSEPGEPSNPENPSEEDKYSISGLVWLDKDKNGIRDNEEKNIQALKVILLNKDGEQLAEEITSLTGKYEFNNIAPGEYIIAFDYDKDNYAVTKYQVQNTNSDMNSDVISKQINLNNEKVIVGITDIINLKDENINNIDMGLVEKPKFDLSLNKYISKVVVTNKEGTKTYEYENTELAKVEIGAKYIEGTILLVEYEIEVENNGDINGYVTDIVDYMPKELEFNSEINTEWYLGTDNYLHYMPLDPQVIEPGKTESIKLVLTKTLKSNSTGTIENIAEIAEGVNLEAVADIDSTPNNKKDGEDDIAKASLIVSIRTGGPLMYIAIVIAIMAVIGLGIYIINKKVLRVKI